MLDVIHSWILAISGVLYQPWFVPVFLIVGGLYFTFRCKFIQVRLFKESFKVITEKPKSENGISSFGALMVSTASRVGTGNIIGVATAICLGGPGAIFWMWLTAFIGGATAFIESTLAQIYKKRDKDGSSYGGPAFYMQTALKQRWLGVIFSFLIIMIYAVGYNMLAAYNLQSTFAAFSFYDAGVTPKLIGLILAILFGVIVIGGAKRLVRVTAVMVPVMGVIYVLVSLLIMALNITNIPHMFAMIFKSAFDFPSIFGGFAGSCIMWGIKRGLYSNEAGMGSTPHAHAVARVKHPCDQGLVAMMGVFIDTLIILNLTAFAVMITGNLTTYNQDLTGAALTQAAFTTGFGKFGSIFIAICMFFFAFSTIIGWYFFGEKNVKYLFSKHTNLATKIYAALVVVFIIVGSTLKVNLVWNLSDLFNNLMVIPNVLGLWALSGTAKELYEDWKKQAPAKVK